MRPGAADQKDSRGWRASLLVVLLMSGCLSSDRLFRGSVLDIEGDILGRYWVIRQLESIFNLPPLPRDDCGDGFVVIRFVIDSHGDVFESSVMHAQPEDCYEEAALRLVQTWTFIPAPFNDRRTPVRVTQRIPFTTD